MDDLNRYIVIGPARLYVEAVPGCHGQGPTYDVKDVYLIDAPTRKAAQWTAWRLAKKRGDLWYTQRFESEHPLTGVEVEDATVEQSEHWPGLYAKDGEPLTA